MSRHYILDEQHNVVPVGAGTDELLRWALWLERADRHVRLTRVGPYTVSTVFLGLDHNFERQGPPIVFETMVWIDQEQEHRIRDRVIKSPRTFIDELERCATWDQALAMHQDMIDKLREPGDAIEEIVRTATATPPPAR